jgi:predicted esterase
MQNQGYEPVWKTYFMGHSVCPDEIGDIAAWLREIERPPA